MNKRDETIEPGGSAGGGSGHRRDRVSHWLVSRAAHAAPAALVSRLEEEWLADLSTRNSAASRLRFALGCWWATLIIARELRAAVPVPSIAAGPRIASAEFWQNAEYLSGRSLTLLVVVALHVALFVALMHELVTNGHKVTEQPLVPTFLPDPHPRELPTLQPPVMEPWRLTIPRPETPPMDNLSDTTEVLADPPKILPPPLPPSPPRIASRIVGGPGTGFPNTDDYYPSISKWKGEQGISTVRVCVDARGRLSAEPTTAESSGSARLDAGALQLAKAGSGRYRPTLEDGKTVDSCYAFRVRFELRN
jgi:TonB family protein